MSSPYRILAVDDERMHLDVIVDVLGDDYRVTVAKDGERALKLAAGDRPPDLCLLDVVMPGMDGYQVCEALKRDARTAPIPVIFLTALGEVEDEARGLKLGAVDYIRKPLSPPILKARVRNHLRLYRHQQDLEATVRERTEELAHTRDGIIYSLCSLTETRDDETGNHVLRTQHYVRLLAEELAGTPRFAPHLDPETVELLFKTAPLHDIGKTGIPDAVLLKPGRLTPEEWEVMKDHVRLGEEALRRAQRESGDTPFFRTAIEIVGSHHERWDGAGYPRGLAGNAIPVAGRLMAIADVYDALISRRVYKPAFPHVQAAELIQAGRGTQFDPDVADAFLRCADGFREVAERYAED